MSNTSNALPLEEETSFEAMRLFLDAYWKRDGRRSEDLAILLGDLGCDPVQRSDWTDAVERALGKKDGVPVRLPALR